jgi:uncharacterized protein YecE (DUF72 family)
MGQHQGVNTLSSRNGREIRVLLCCCHAPADLPNTIPSVWEVTHPDLAIVRLHGRNHSTWNLKGLSSSAERFNYDYTTDELVDVAAMTRELSRQAEITQVIFNNNYEDQGQRNGREMIALLAANS